MPKQSLSDEQLTWINEAKQYHPADDDQLQRYAEIAFAFETMAKAIYENMPPCPDRTAALRKLLEVKMTANHCIALRGFGIAQ